MRRIGFAAMMLALLAIFSAAAFRPDAAGAAGAMPRFSKAQSHFSLQCAGCHGLGGESVPTLIPTLRNNVGYFLCTPKGREYLGRLPNVALSRLNDEDLADVLNFVVFSLAAKTVPANAPKYSAEEIRRLRAHPLNHVSLIQYRHEVVQEVMARCGAPASLAAYNPRTN